MVQQVEKVVKKRNKPSLSCFNCRKRKTRCDRKLPCSACQLSERAVSCAYSSGGMSDSVYTGGKKSEVREYPELVQDVITYSREKRPDESFEKSRDLGSVSGLLPYNYDMYPSVSPPVVSWTQSVQSSSTSLHPLPQQGPFMSIQNASNLSLGQLPLTHPISIPSPHHPRIQNSNKGIPSIPPIRGIGLNRNGRYGFDPQLREWPEGDVQSQLRYSQPFLRCPLTGNEDVSYSFEDKDPPEKQKLIESSSLGPLSWISLVHRDPWLEVLRANTSAGISHLFYQLFSSIPIHEFSSNFYPQEEKRNKPYDMNSNYPTHNANFEQYILKYDGVEDWIPFKKLQESGVTNTNIKLARSLFEGRVSMELHLIERIKSIMPTKKVLWTLVEVFFAKVYVFFPFVDESTFIGNVIHLLGPREYSDTQVTLRIDKKADLAFVALLLIILRITFLFHFSNISITEVRGRPTESSDMALELEVVLNNPINMVVIDVAQSCIDCFDVTRRCNLSLFQALIFMRIYNRYAPEGGDDVDGGESRVATVMMVQMATSLGLNREASSLDSKEVHLARKIWQDIKSASELTLTTGSILKIDLSRCDTKEPSPTLENSNHHDFEVEVALTEMLKLCKEQLEKSTVVFDMLLNVRDPPRINNLCRAIDDLVFDLRNKSYLTRQDMDAMAHQTYLEKCKNCYKSSLYFSSQSSSMTLHYVLFLYYEQRKPEYAYYYLDKTFFIIYHFVSPYIYHAFRGELAPFGFHINTSIILLLQKFNQVHFALLLRCMYRRSTLEASVTHGAQLQADLKYAHYYSAIVRLENACRSFCEASLKLLKKFTARYYIAWRICKIQLYLYNSFLQGNPIHAPKNPENTLPYSGADLDGICLSISGAAEEFHRTLSGEDAISKPRLPLSRNRHTPSSDSVLSTEHKVREEFDQVWLKVMALKRTSNDSEKYLFDRENTRAPEAEGTEGIEQDEYARAYAQRIFLTNPALEELFCSFLGPDYV